MLDFLGSLWDKITSGLLGIILDAILYAIAVILYYIEAALGEVLDMVYNFFNVFAGASPIQYNGQKTYILNVFFEDSTIGVIYKGMAMIGIVMLFVFTLIAVGKKMFDSTGEHVKATYGMILTNTFKGGFFILAMTIFMNMMVVATGALLDSITYLFNNANALKNPTSITFDNEDYANMFRVLDKISNRAMDPGYNNRYNLNTCFNEICNDMQSLESEGVFKFDYSKATDSWQYDLYQIYMAADIKSGIAVDVYNENLVSALLSCIYDLKYNTSFRPLSSYSIEVSTYEETTPGFGTILMLSSTMNAANNGAYNGNNASITDAVRGPFYLGYRDIYDRDTVESAFTIELGRWDHITCLASLGICLIEFCKLIFHCIARLYNMIVLYLLAPGFIAVLPLDDGEKLKQWTTSFIIQCFSLFGNYVAVRLLVVMVPIIESNSLVLFSNPSYNFIAKDVFIVGLCVTAQKAGAMIGGILSGNAGYSSMAALEAGNGIVGKGEALMGKLAKGTLGLAKAAGGAALSKSLGALGALTGATTLKNKIGKKMAHFGKALRDNGGLYFAHKAGYKTDEDREKEAADTDKARAAKKEEEKEKERDARMDKIAGILDNAFGSGKDGGKSGDAKKIPTAGNKDSAQPQNLRNVGSDNSNSQGGDKPITNLNPNPYKGFKSMGSDENYEAAAAKDDDDTDDIGVLSEENE